MNITDNNIQKDCCQCAGMDLVLYSALVSIILAKDLTITQQNLLGSFIQSIGQNLYILAASRSKCESKLVEKQNSHNIC